MDRGLTDRQAADHMSVTGAQPVTGGTGWAAGPRIDHDGDVVGGAVVIALVLVVVLPVLFLITGAVGSVVMGWLLGRYAEDTHEGSELVETNY
jgi:hypothetical protein